MVGDSINGIHINSIEKYQPDVIYLYCLFKKVSIVFKVKPFNVGARVPVSLTIPLKFRVLLPSLDKHSCL